MGTFVFLFNFYSLLNDFLLWFQPLGNPPRQLLITAIYIFILVPERRVDAIG